MSNFASRGVADEPGAGVETGTDEPAGPARLQRSIHDSSMTNVTATAARRSIGAHRFATPDHAKNRWTVRCGHGRRF